MSSTRVGRAHLLLLLHSGGDEALARLSRFLDYAPSGKPPSDFRARETTKVPAQIEKPQEPDLLSAAKPILYPQEASPVTFWYAATFSPIGEDIERRISAADSGSVDLPLWDTDPKNQPQAPPLAPWRELLPSLQRELAERAGTRQLDLPAAVHRFATGRSCFPLPLRSSRRWGSTITLIEDRSIRLTPYWADQGAVAIQMAAIYPSHGLRHAIVWDGQLRPLPSDLDQPAVTVWPPPPESPVLVLSDLGGLAGSNSRATTEWARLGAELSDLGCNAVAVSPVPREALADPVRSYWQVITWERGASAFGERRLQRFVQQVLAALAIAVRIEPGLLREVRRALGLPAAVEAKVWQDTALSSRSSVAATLRADAAQALQAAFLELQPDEQERVLERIHAWRGGLPPEVWFAEIQALPTALRDRLPFVRDAVASDAFFAALGRRLHGVGANPVPAGLQPWFRFIAPRLRAGIKEDPELGIHFQRLYRSAFAHIGSPPDIADYDPALAAGVDALASSMRCSVTQQGCAIRLSDRGVSVPQLPPGSWLGSIETQLGEVKITPLLVDRKKDFWDGGQPPSWAADWGWDDYGAWVTFPLKGKVGELVVQRMRWIEPGSFLMGSPEDEPGRWDDEGPRHGVTIREGFWLFDTPCTQALWEAVMGENPSRFKSPERPVEQVSWEDVQEFMQRLNARIPGLDLVLPSEAQWERACRAGTETALYTGAIEILGEANAPALDPIAWYRGNSGVDFELEDGWDSSDWREVQYPNPKSGTHPVKGKQPNAWGLYDMLGNVWEWAQDNWHKSYDSAPSNPDGTSTAVFISCSHQDKKWLQRLQVHLKPLVRAGDIDLWDETRIRPSADWNAEIDRALVSARFAVLLVSAHFLASDFVQNQALLRLLEAAEKRGTRILPVMVSHSLFTNSPLGRFQAINVPDKPLEQLTKAGQDKVFRELALAIAEGLADGSPWESGGAGAGRVFRGGSWSSNARHCRCACRSRRRPDDRGSHLGFRCARVQVGEPGRQGAERVNLTRPGPRSGSGRAASDSARVAAVTIGADAHEQGKLPALLRLNAGTEAVAPLPEAPAILIRTDREQLTLRRITKPDWASAIGRDRYGLWTEIAVEPSQGAPVIQRLRWFPPGRFIMGSPADEPGRWEAEGPQHGVMLGTGFWLFDTPCTQALWEALLGENPSRFQDPERPVEQVSWEDVQQHFLPALNERISEFVLPSEAQWEYACRAGTETALYTGPIEILGDMNAPALDLIAWYGGNSGVDFDLPEGEDSTTGWWESKDKQYPHERAGTRKVKGKQPNPWGLYDMLGNVWEWCEDNWHEGYEDAPVDGSAWVQDAAGAVRVFRGGSWLNVARNCRCAQRSFMTKRRCSSSSSRFRFTETTPRKRISTVF